MKLLLASMLLLTAGLAAQPVFEFQTPGPFPLLPNTDVECVGALTSNSFNPYPSITNVPVCGMPQLGGFQYARIEAGGLAGVTIPAGGPIPLAALTGNLHGIQLPIPPGASLITFAWEFFDAESSPTYNDAFEVSVLDGLGNPIGAPLVYADVAFALANPGTCTDPTSFGTEIGAPLGVNNGPQIFFGPLPVGGVTLNIVCANSSDDAVASAAFIDDIQFDVPYGCFIPTFTLVQPSSGTLAVSASNGIPFASYLMPVRIGAPGAYPAGWCLGIDMALADLILEINTGYPFVGSLDGAGSFTFFLGGGVPAGLPIQAGFATFDANGMNMLFPPQSITTF